VARKAKPLSEFPELAMEFHPTLNKPLKAADFSSASQEPVWWLGQCGHTWQQRIYLRTTRNYGCAFCSGKVVLAGFNDLASQYPKLAKQWDPARNSLTPNAVSPGSGKKFFWICEKGHSYQASVTERVRRIKKGFDSACPVCLNRKIVPGVNGLAISFPELLREWDNEKNFLNPAELPPGLKRKVWWICPLGHSYDMSPFHRTTGKQNGPNCAGKRIVVGHNDLGTISPEIAKSWDSAKNPQHMSPERLTAKARGKYWWRCNLNHSFQATVAHRTEGKGCPYCAGLRLLTGFNDLSTLRPELAKSWSSKNELSADQVVNGSGKRFLWMCELGHEWSAAPIWVKGCPVCANTVVLTGFNDLKSVNPILASEWHPTRNTTSPDEVIAGSGKKYWWLCQFGHAWSARPSDRKRTGCPRCGMGGFDQSKAGRLYFIINKDLASRKVGITNLDSDRLSRFIREGWSVIATWESQSGLLLMELERLVFSWLRNDLGLPPYLTIQQMRNTGGWSETFSEEGPTNLIVRNQIQEFYNQLTSYYEP